MTKEEAEKYIKSKMCNDCGVYLGGGKCSDDCKVIEAIKLLEQETKTVQYEKHIDHTDCIWYGNDSGCPVTCSQYRDGWNDAMDYIFNNGKGYEPYRHDS